MTIDLRPTVDAPDDDPYLWLEDIHGERACAWADAQSARTRAKFASPAYEADVASLTAILDRADKLPFVTRRGVYVYNFWQDKAHPRGLWRRTTLDSFRTDTPAWDVVLDLDALAKREGEDWVWQGAVTLPGTHDRAILRLSRGGSDASVMREFDLEQCAFVEGGFHLPEAKGGADWWDRDTLVVTTALGGEAFVTDSGYARTVRIWRRGTAFDDANLVFEVPRSRMSCWAGVERGKSRRVWYIDKPGFFDAIYAVGDLTGPRHTFDVPQDCWLDSHRDWLTIKPRTPWTVGGMTHPADRLLGIGLDAFMAGDRDFTVLFEPGPRRALESWSWAKERLIVSSLDELQPRFEVWQPSATGWTNTTLTGVPAAGVVSVGRLDADEDESDGTLISTSEDPLTPPTLTLLEPARARVVLKRSSRTFDPTGLIVTQHEAVAADGERIPYTQVGPPNLSGDAPVHMTGYGGFRSSARPYYASAVGKLWLERGGTHVSTNIRGGGEFGTRWHQAGMRAAKATSHDDFAAIAADLVRRGVTTPKRIAAEGGSNGGILISNMLTRYPERFGALFCTIPLIDMRRYSKLLAGASWVAEYGDPDKPEDWAHLKTYSAYHAAGPGRPYPPILIATTRKDDRVHPGHARKFAAKLQAMGYANVDYFEPATGGHGYGKDNAERARFIVLGYHFLADAIGWRFGAGAA